MLGCVIAMLELRRNRGVGRIFVVILWIAMLAASFLLITTVLNTFFSGPSGSRLVSTDWAGYVVLSDSSNPQPVVVGVNGSWTVPTVTVSASDEFSATWIGIGGYLDQTLIQTGSEQDSINGTAEYSVWYELLPNDSITINMNVAPGDRIQASIKLVDSVTDEWLIEIADVTTAQRFMQNVFYNSSQLSAEWIVERPFVNNAISTLADFNSVTFTDAKATMDSNVGTIRHFPYAQVTMRNRQNVQLVTVSSLSSDGSSFTVNYLATASAQRFSENTIASVHVGRHRKTVN